MKIGKNVYITNNLNYQRYEVNCIPKGDCVILFLILEKPRHLSIWQNMSKENIPFKFNFFWRKYAKSNE